jgi:hypothetical protein
MTPFVSLNNNMKFISQIHYGMFALAYQSTLLWKDESPRKVVAIWCVVLWQLIGLIAACVWIRFLFDVNLLLPFRDFALIGMILISGVDFVTLYPNQRGLRYFDEIGALPEQARKRFFVFGFVIAAISMGLFVGSIAMLS